MKIVIDRDIPFLQGVFEPYAEVAAYPGNAIGPNELRNADGLIVRTRTRCDGQLLAGSSVRAVATATIGYDHIDRDFCRDAGISWSNAPGCNAGGVLQYAAATLAEAIQAGVLTSASVLGVVGCGAVGSRVADAFSALGFTVLRNDPPRMEQEGLQRTDGFYPLEELLREADGVFLHLSLERGGRWPGYHLLHAGNLCLMKPHSLLVNAARGEAVDGAALLRQLEAGPAMSAVLDVWENEPEINRALLDRVFLGTAHIAGYSVEGKANGTVAAVRFIARELGLPLTGWLPESFPEPGTELLSPDACRDWKCAVAEAYDIRADHLRLKQDPGSFEALRSSYNYRREFSAYRIPDNSCAAQLAALEFHRTGSGEKNP